MSLPEIAGHELHDLIGGGCVGAVYRASSTAGQACAVKVFSSMAINRKGLGQTLRQIQAMPPHRGVLPILGFEVDRSPYFCATPLIGLAVKDEQGRKIWQAPSLEAQCGRATPDQAWNYIYEIADALAWMHKHGIGHGNLKPSNILLTNDPEGTIRLTDLGQGWVGGIHHLELNDHFMHLAPEQCEQPEVFFAGQGLTCDVYSFGVLSYRLLTGQFPRAPQAWAQELAHRQQQNAKGLGYSINNMALLQAVRTQPRITWPSAAASKWDERRRGIIERALETDPAKRWKDMREITREFEVLESDYLLEDAREKIEIEKRRQAKKVALLQTIGTGLTVALALAIIYGFITLVRARSAEGSITTNLASHKVEIDQREGKISSLTAELKGSQEAKKIADTNLQNAQSMVDQLITQLLQLPTESNLQVAFSKQQLDEATAFIQATLPALEKAPALAPERARAYGNLGMIAVKQRNTEVAAMNLGKARTELQALITSQSTSPHANLFHQWLGRYSLLLANMKSSRGEGDAAMDLLKEATANLDPGVQANPKDRNARWEAARAWFDYGVRSRKQSDMTQSADALARVSAALDPKAIGGPLLPEESFLLARGNLERGLAQRDSGKLEEAVTTLVASVEEMANLVAGSSPRNQEQAIVLAEAYTELGDIVGRHFSAKEATDAHFEAIKVLLELLRLDPDWPEANYLLARNYGEVAGLERDAGNNPEAVRKKQDAIQIMGEVVANDPGNPRYHYHKAKLRGELAELMGDLGKAKDALPIAKESITAMEALLKTVGPTMTAERKEWEVQLALLYGILGQTSETAKQKELARTSFKTAETQWAKLSELDKSNEVIQQGLSWTRNRLLKLK